MPEKPKHKIEKLIKYIENNIKQDINLEILSDYSGLSKYHLNRTFKAITGKALIEYVRYRKLSCSIEELLYTNLRITDIAYEYNFTYEQSYIRTFRNIFGISPDKFRKEKPALEIMEPINLDLISEIGQEGIIINPMTVIKPSFKVIGLKHKIYYKDNNDFYVANKVGNDFFENHRSEIKNSKNPNSYIGLIEYVDGIYDYKYYMTCLEVENLEDLPNGMVMNIIPTQKYSVFTYIGSHHAKDTTIDSLREIYGYIFENWVNNTNYIFKGKYHFESIDNEISRDDYCEVKIFIPIEDKVT